MARIRTIKPAFFRDVDLYELEREVKLPVRVAFAGLWTTADKEGRFRWHPRELKLDCLPHDDLDFSDVLSALERGRFIGRYEVGGKVYGYIRSWREHQRPRNDEEPSRLPEPPPQGADTMPSLLRDEAVPGQSLGKERKGKEVEGNGEGGAMVLREPESPILLLFPTVGKGEQEWRLRRAQVDEWQTAYPGIDVFGECQKALVWVKATPGHRKTAGGMCRFLVGWLNRATNNGGGHHGPSVQLGDKAKLTAALERGSQW